MRKYINIDLVEQKATKEEIDGENVIVVGRHLIAKTLLERGVAQVDALSPENPLIFSAGPFSGSNFSMPPSSNLLNTQYVDILHPVLSPVLIDYSFCWCNVFSWKLRRCLSYLQSFLVLGFFQEVVFTCSLLIHPCT